ncbi:MAG: Rieske (2Fe-2S) protein [Chitinophagaceae bacterium]
MTVEKYTWQKVADHIQELNFAENNIAIADLMGKKICIAKHNNELFAFSLQCPHAGGIMADGYIDPKGIIVCPRHGYRYDMKNGRNISGEGYYLKHWLLSIRENGIFVSVETPDWK